MKVHNSIQNVPFINFAVVTSGTFDGVHIGHQKILSRLTETAKQFGGQSVVISFWPHPRMVVSDDSQDLKLLTTIDEKIELLEKNGIDHLLIIPFTREFSELSSDDFIQKILVNTLNTKKLVIGYDHRFGRNREGGFDYLINNAQKFGFEIEEISKQEIDNLTISSTKIREALLGGEVNVAEELLGRSYEFSGVVTKGRQLGRQLGFPTANVKVAEVYKLIPADGVYAVTINVRNSIHHGIMNIGKRPTVDGIHRTMEVHIFDFDFDIYGEQVVVFVKKFIRSEKKFDGLEQLKSQITNDCEDAKAFLTKLSN